MAIIQIVMSVFKTNVESRLYVALEYFGGFVWSNNLI